MGIGVVLWQKSRIEWLETEQLGAYTSHQNIQTGGPGPFLQKRSNFDYCFLSLDFSTFRAARTTSLMCPFGWASQE